MATVKELLLRLTDLPLHRCGIVRDVETDDEEAQRLKMLGVCRGRHVQLVRGGDPLILKIFGSRLGISGELARRVQVEICQSENCSLRQSELHE